METTPVPAPQKPLSRISIFLRNIFSIAIAVGLALLVQHFLVRPFLVNGGSMDPTFETNDYLLIDRLTYRFSNPTRGDVIIFKAPPEPDKYFIKRVIGLPGDTVELHDGIVTIKDAAHPDGMILPDTFVTHKSHDTKTFIVPEGEYFVMGDNRAGSFDSRSWGTLPKENISGRALVRLYPFSLIDYLPGKITF